MTQQPSPQQAAAIEWVRTGSGNAILKAVAGAGKTTTLLRMVEALPAGQRALIVAFNKSIAEEIQGKIAARGLAADAGTIHSIGFQTLRRAMPNLKMDKYKIANIMQQMGIADFYHDVVRSLVSHAKNAGLGALETANDVSRWNYIFTRNDLAVALPEEVRGADAQAEAIRLAQRVLEVSNGQINLIDYDDMIYMPLHLGLKPFQYDFVMLDEAQDTNATRRAIVGQMVKPGGRFVAVGDERQAIYGFTGADSDSLDLIARDFNAVALPLTVTYRCPKVVVKYAQQWVSHIEAHESAPEGEYKAIAFEKLFDENPGSGDAILCRKTAPLISLAYALIRRGVACKIEGRNDIGAGLIKMIYKWKRTPTVDSFLTKLDDWAEKEMEKARVKKNDSLMQAIEDRVECLHAIASVLKGSDPLKALADRVNSIFAEDVHKQAGMLVLATIHKSKGKEWERVFWVGRAEYQPSKYARQDWQIEQEYNLMYVAATRAKAVLIEVSAPPSKSVQQRKAA